MCSENILYFFSNLFRSKRVGTPILNEWTGVAVLCCHGKSSSYIPTSKFIWPCSTYHKKPPKKLPMLFYLEFQMKCKYIIMKLLIQGINVGIFSVSDHEDGF